MKKCASFFSWTVLIVVVVNLLASCSPKNGGPSQLSQAGLPQTPTRPSGISSDGTSDSGGGTGIDGQVFESYMVDPVALPAYQQVLHAMLARITPENPAEPFDYQSIFKIKTWYIAPVDLDKINKDVLGVSFLKTETEQIARQTSKEVWIDKRIFDRMPLQRQAELLLHEMVMNMYFFKFMTFTELCNVSRTAGIHASQGRESCEKSAPLLEQALPAESKRPLNAADNESIRFVTAWLIQNLQHPVSVNTFYDVLQSQGFDKRLFHPTREGSGEPKNEIHVSRQELYQAIHGATLAGQMPDLCTGELKQNGEPCEFTVSEATIASANFQLPALAFELKLHNRPAITFKVPVGSEVSLLASEDIDGKTVFVYAGANMKELFQVGDRTYFALFLFSKDTENPSAPLLLSSVILKPSVIVSIDRARDPVCLIRAPAVNDLADDSLTIRHKGASSTTVERLYINSKPAAFCTKDNVAP
jgi:hypothetical protein